MKCEPVAPKFPVRTIGDSVQTGRVITIRSTGAESSVGKWQIPEELPVAFVFNRRNYAVMLATPADFTDYAVGFSLTEGVIDAPENISSLDITHSEQGTDFRIRIEQDLLDRLDVRQRRRNLVGTAGCGVCGLENAERFFQKLPIVSEAPVLIDEAAIVAAMQKMEEHQPINQATRSVHGAAFVSPAGEIRLLREDVGRHNALDKLLGALALAGIGTDDGFVLMSSRCSYELVEKAARRGVKALVSISGPTAFAMRKAKEANMTLYARAGNSAVRLTQ